MDTRTGEIKNFEPGEELPHRWVLIPPVGTEVEVHFRQKLENVTRKRRGKVVEIQEGKPGKLMIEMLPWGGGRS